jgi:hypothetical protein
MQNHPRHVERISHMRKARVDADEGICMRRDGNRGTTTSTPMPLSVAAVAEARVAIAFVVVRLGNRVEGIVECGAELVRQLDKVYLRAGRQPAYVQIWRLRPAAM